jgi:cyanate permease
MTPKVWGALAIIAIASTLRIAAASAGPCAGEIADFRSSLSRDKNGDLTFVPAAPQTIGAQLAHQPTRQSVERAKKQAQAQLLTVVAQAEALDSEGKQGECRNALAKAKLLLNP